MMADGMSLPSTRSGHALLPITTLVERRTSIQPLFEIRGTAHFEALRLLPSIHYAHSGQAGHSTRCSRFHGQRKSLVVRLSDSEAIKPAVRLAPLAQDIRLPARAPDQKNFSLLASRPARRHAQGGP
jgi:hypothetical protein